MTKTKLKCHKLKKIEIYRSQVHTEKINQWLRNQEDSLLHKILLGNRMIGLKMSIKGRFI